jgi:hypothetical protein
MIMVLSMIALIGAFLGVCYMSHDSYKRTKSLEESYTPIRKQE